MTLINYALQLSLQRVKFALQFGTPFASYFANCEIQTINSNSACQGLF